MFPLLTLRSGLPTLNHYLRVSQVAIVVKKLPANAGDIRDMGLIPGSWRSPGRGHGNSLQYSCLENSVYRGARRATVHRVTESRTRLKRLSTLTSLSNVSARSPRLQCSCCSCAPFFGGAQVPPSVSSSWDRQHDKCEMLKECTQITKKMDWRLFEDFLVFIYFPSWQNIIWIIVFPSPHPFSPSLVPLSWIHQTLIHPCHKSELC